MALDLFLTILFVILIRLLIAESFLTTCQKYLDYEMGITTKDLQAMINKINVLKDTVAEMKEAETHQKEIVKQAEEELQKLKDEKEQVIFQMEADSQIIELHQSMDALNTNNESERMLERVREGAKKTRERAEGSRIAYDSSAQAADRRLEASERERNAREILEEAKRQRGK